MQKLVGGLMLCIGVFLAVTALVMDTTVTVRGQPSQVIGTTYGTTTIPGTPDQVVHNVGLMQQQSNTLILGSVVSIAGLLLLLLGGAKPVVQPVADESAAKLAAMNALPHDEQMRALGVVENGGRWVFGGETFDTPEAAVIFAKLQRFGAY